MFAIFYSLLIFSSFVINVLTNKEYMNNNNNNNKRALVARQYTKISSSSVQYNQLKTYNKTIRSKTRDWSEMS